MRTARRHALTREDAFTYLDRHVRIAHAGPWYVRRDDPEGLIVAITDTLTIMEDVGPPGGKPRAWALALIAAAQCLDEPDDAGSHSRSQSKSARRSQTTRCYPKAAR